MGMIALSIWLLIGLTLRTARWLRTHGGSGRTFKIVLEGGTDRIVRVANKADLPEIRGAQRVIVAVGRRSVTAKLERRNTSSKFKLDSIALTQSVMDQLALSPDDEEEVDPPRQEDGVSLTLSRLPWYSPRGLLDRTIFDPDQNTSLTWRIFLLSLIVSVFVSEVYYERAIADQAVVSHQAGP